MFLNSREVKIYYFCLNNLYTLSNTYWGENDYPVNIRVALFVCERYKFPRPRIIKAFLNRLRICSIELDGLQRAGYPVDGRYKVNFPEIEHYKQKIQAKKEQIKHEIENASKFDFSDCLPEFKEKISKIVDLVNWFDEMNCNSLAILTPRQNHSGHNRIYDYQGQELKIGDVDFGITSPKSFTNSLTPEIKKKVLESVKQETKYFRKLVKNGRVDILKEEGYV